MALTAPTTSTFARLFKQSKFSSFDPVISQVYTTHGGDAHRGHWGFKRPLPLRRRGAYITVKNVDTPEYQTEWNSAEPQALWMKNWDELKIHPQRSPLDQFRAEAIMESDFAPNKEDPKTWRQAYLPNLEVMTRDEFKKYLERIRQSRSRFLGPRLSGEEAETSYQLGNSHKSVPWHDVFASDVSRRRRENPFNKTIEHMPHVNHGLSYAQYSPLQTFLMTKERKGRLADEYVTYDRKQTHYVASFAGIAGRVLKKHAGLGKPMIWEDPNNTGVVMLRPQKVVLQHAPTVVGARQGLKAAKIAVDLRVGGVETHRRSNPHTPGSREYIAAEPPAMIQEFTARARMVKMERGKRRTATHQGSTLNLLQSAMRKGQGRK